MVLKKKSASLKRRVKAAWDPESSDTSRDKLIRSATKLFADRGFDGVSVRDIANDAMVNSALVGYYFGGKEGLLAEVYTLHFEPLKQERARLLAAVTERNATPQLEDVLEAFIRPSLQANQGSGDSHNFYRLRAILAAENSSLLEQVVAQTFDDASRAFIDALSACLPQLTHRDIFWRFHFLLGAIYYSATGPKRIKSLSGGACDPSDPAAATWELIHIAAAAFRAPGFQEPQEPHRALRHKRRRSGSSLHP
jgi:AcrR family transcriptional regulator